MNLKNKIIVLQLLRSQLKVYPYWRELYKTASECLFEISDERFEIRYEEVLKCRHTAVMNFVEWSKSNNIINWSLIDDDLIKRIRKKKSCFLVPELDTFIEVGE